MKLLHTLFEKAYEELAEAECYAELALEHKATHETIAARLYRLADEEVTQADTLMSMVKELYEEKRREGKITERDEIKNELKVEQYNEEKAEVKLVQAAYKM